MVDLTRHPRQVVTAGVDFQWNSKLWVHNIFRVYELMFGRRAGIRIEGLSNSAGQYSYTWEHLFAVWEGVARAALKRSVPKLRVVYVPQLQLAGLSRGGVSPFRFAIAFDSATPKNYSFTGGTTFTVSATVTGSNPTVTLAGPTNNTGGVPVASASYNSVAATSGVNIQVGNENVYIWYVPSAATGSNTASVTASAVAGVGIEVLSLTGTAASPGGASNSSHGSGTSSSVAVTTTAANSWVVDQIYVDNKPISASPTGTNQTARGTDIGDAGFTCLASTETTTTTGSYTMSWSWSGSNNWIQADLEIKPLAAVVVNSGFFLVL